MCYLHFPCFSFVISYDMKIGLRHRCNPIHFLFKLLPALDLEILQLLFAEGLDEGGSQTRIGDERNIVVDSTATDLVAVGQLAFRVVLRNVDNQVELMIVNHVHHILAS